MYGVCIGVYEGAYIEGCYMGVCVRGIQWEWRCGGYVLGRGVGCRMDSPIYRALTLLPSLENIH